PERRLDPDRPGHPHRPDREPDGRGLSAGVRLRRAGPVRLRRTQAALLTRRGPAAATVAGSSCRAAQSSPGVGALAAATTARSSAAEATLAITAETSGRPIT